MYIIYDDFYLKHDSGIGHPESPERLAAIKDALDSSENFNKFVFIAPEKADTAQLSLVHSEKYIEKIKYYSDELAPHYLDADTLVSRHTYDCAALAAGGCIKGIDLLMKHRCPEGRFFFALVRPPGHHAFRSQGSGFCIFNNAAIAAKYAFKKYGIRKIALVDFDVHHGNGTQNIFYKSPELFYVSLHQFPHYPGTGQYYETGEDGGRGYNLNIPLAPGSGELDYIKAFKELVIPLVTRFEPEMILVSAGFDGHREDILSSMDLCDEAFYKIMHMVIYLRTAIADIQVKKNLGFGIVLEGGYNISATARSVVKVTDAVLEEDLHKGLDSTGTLMEFLSADSSPSAALKEGNNQVFDKIKNIFNM